MNLTATQIITDSLVKLGVLRFGQAPTADLLAGGFSYLNGLIDEALVDELMVLAIVPDVYTLTGARTYSIGPTGDFTAARPTRIEEANYLFTNSNPIVRKPVAILTAYQWSLIGVQAIDNAVVNAIFYENNFTQPDGNGTLHVWPGAPAGNQLELFTWKQLQSFADLTTTYGFAPAYSEWMKWTLAKKLIPSVGPYLKGDKTLISFVVDQAQAAKAALQGYNQRDIMSYCDPDYLVGQFGAGSWDFRSGFFGKSGSI